MSSKLSGRRSTARKPPICLSKPLPPKWWDNVCSLRILWTDFLATPPLILIDETVTLQQYEPGSPVFTYENTGAGPSTLAWAQLVAPYFPTDNYLAILGNDEGGASHIAENFFQPGRPVPFIQDLELYSYDYAEPGSVLAFIRPISQ